jgi:hypothetical protein
LSLDGRQQKINLRLCNLLFVYIVIFVKQNIQNLNFKIMAKTVVVTKEINANKALGIAKSENNFQGKIERYQIANKSANYSKDARIERAKELADTIATREKNLTKAGLKSLANYTTLLQIWKEFLSGLKEEMFILEASIGVRRDLAQGTKAGGKIPKEQENVLIEYHTNKARANWDTVMGIRKVLELKGLLKPTPATGTLPAAEEIAVMKEAVNS